MITACNATSIRLRGASSEGKNDPVRVFGIRTVRSPAVVETVLSRVPLRWVVRAADRSCGPAPITAEASASTSSWSMKPSIIRIISPASAAFSRSPSSSRADWFSVTA